MVEAIRLCSDAIAIFPDKLCLFSMYEDNDLENYEDARTEANWLIENGAPLLLIEQYNSVNAVCGNAALGHWDCWHYDPQYALYLVPVKTWEAHHKDALGIHAEHQHKYSRCKADPIRVEQELQEAEERRLRDEEIPF